MLVVPSPVWFAPSSTGPDLGICRTTRPSSITTHVLQTCGTAIGDAILAGALQRGLAGLLVSLVRLRGTEFNPNDTASRVTTGNPYVQEAIETISKRAELIGDGPKTGDFCRAELLSKADVWQAEAQNTAGGRTLTYKEGFGEGAKKGTTVSLLSSPGLERWEEFTCLNSLREVEPPVKFIISDGGLDGAVDEDDEETPEQEEGQA